MSGKKTLKFKILPAIFLAGFLFFNLINIRVFAFPLEKINCELTVVALGKEYKFFYPEIDLNGSEPYLKNAAEVVDGIYLDTIVRPKDAKVQISPEKEYPFEFIKERQGKAIDKESLLISIEKALLVGNKKIVANEIPLSPSITVEKLRKSTYRRAFFTTGYAYSSEERKSNIRLCANLIGGVQLNPYQEFSFNQAVGERTEERGFKSAKVIEKGKFIDGIGGGVCQVSSTLYNAVLLGGLKVTERHPHSMAVSYVEPSFDAMVSMGYADLKVVNNSNDIVFIVATAKENTVTVTVYGTKTQITYKRVSEVIEKIAPPEMVRTLSSEVDVGKERVLVYQKDGLISQGFLEIYNGDKLINTLKLSKDKYAPLQGELLYNDGTI